MRRVLVVDDAAFFREKLAALLMANGVGAVAEAETGKEAISFFHGTRFDAVILDVALPDVDGLSVLAVMKRLDVRVPVLVVTAAASVDVVQVARRGGAAGVLVKPVEEDRLLRTLKSLLDGK